MTKRITLAVVLLLGMIGSSSAETVFQRFEVARNVEEFLALDAELREQILLELLKLKERIADVGSLDPATNRSQLIEGRELFLRRADALEREFTPLLASLRCLSELSFAEEDAETRNRLMVLIYACTEHQRLSAELRDALRGAAALSEERTSEAPSRIAVDTRLKSIQQTQEELRQVGFVLAQRYQQPAYKQLVQQHRSRVMQLLAAHKQDAQLAREYIAIIKSEIPVIDLAQMVGSTSSALEQQLSAAEARWRKLHADSQAKMAQALAERRAAFRRLAEMAAKARLDERERFVAAAISSGTVARPAFEDAWKKAEGGKDEKDSKKKGGSSETAAIGGEESNPLMEMMGEDEDLMIIFKIAMLVAAA